MGDPIVRLNVGGKPFDAAQSTLTRSPFFVRMLDGSMGAPKLDADGRIFIDHDPEGFAAVLRYLRTGVEHQLDSNAMMSFEYFGLGVREEEPEMTVEDLPGYEDVVKTLGEKIAVVNWPTQKTVCVPRKAEMAWKTAFGLKPAGVKNSGGIFDDADLTKALNASLDLDRFSLATAKLWNFEPRMEIRLTLGMQKQDSSSLGRKPGAVE